MERYLSKTEIDVLGEIGNISLGNATTTLSALLNKQVKITTPSVNVVERDLLSREFPKPHVAVKINYEEGLEGTNLLIFKNKDASIISNLMLGGDGKVTSEEIGELEISAIQEVMNQMIGTSSTSLSSMFDKKIQISPPDVQMFDLKSGKGLDLLPNEDLLVKVSFRLSVEGLIESNLMQLYPVSFAKEFVRFLIKQ